MAVDRPNRNAILFLGPEEVKGMINMEEAVAAIEQGYKEADEYPIGNAPRRRVHSPDGVRVSNFPGGIPGLGVIGSLTRAESVTHDEGNQTYPYREHPVYLLWDSETAKLDGIMMGELFDERTGFSSVMAFRTGATTGVGVKALSRPESKVFGLLGSGGQAVNKILAIDAVRDIETVKVYSRNPENRLKFCAEMTAIIEKDVVPVDSAEEAVRGSDVVISATNSNVPTFDGEWLEPGMHVSCISMFELETAVVKAADVVSTHIGECDPVFIKTEGIGILPEEPGAGFQNLAAETEFATLPTIAEFVAGKAPGRTSDDQITCMINSVGCGYQFSVLGYVLLKRAREEGVGQDIPSDWFTTTPES